MEPAPNILSTPRRGSVVAWGIDDVELLQVVEAGNDFLKEAVERAKRKLTTGADSLPPTPAPTPSTDRQGGDGEGGGAQMSWTIRFPPSSGDDIGYRLGVRDGTADDPDTKVFVAEVSLSGGSHPEMRVGDEVLEINKMRPIDGMRLLKKRSRSEIVLRLTTRHPELRLQTLLPKSRALSMLASRPASSTLAQDVVILKLPTEQDKEEDALEDSIVYQYSLAPWMTHSTQLLKRVTGGLLTLYAQLSHKEGVTHDTVSSASMQDGNDSIHVTFRPFGPAHILMVTTSCADAALDDFQDAVVQAMACFETLHGGCSAAAIARAGQERLDGFFQSLFQMLPLTKVDPTVLSTFGNPPRMFCSENISLEISDVLDVLETKCVSTSNGRPDVSLAVGSCLFYRESLVWSHFNSTDLGVISDICKHFGMITTVPAVSASTVCFRVYGTSANTPDSDAYLLITMLEKATMCLLVKRWKTFTAPSTVEISQVRDVELRLHMLHVNGTLNRINECSLTSTQKPRGLAKGVSLDDKWGGSDLALISNSRGKRSLRRALSTTHSSTTHLIATGKGATDPDVMHSVHVDGLTGVVVVGASAEAGARTSNLVAMGVLRNFYRMCRLIRKTLMQRRTAIPGAFGHAAAALGEVDEYGLMFSCDRSGAAAVPSRAVSSDNGRDSKPLVYWVVGRKFGQAQNDEDDTVPEEFYVCFLDGTRPQIVEHAFELKGKLLS